ncbi:MAG: RseA family anti-sigma factor [Silanimonas sp.]
MPPNALSGSDDFREQLSAWRDGALPDEASRFVLKRLLQDDALRAEVGRWQVIGDALRRQPQQRPVCDVAARVATALDDAAFSETALGAVITPATVSASRSALRRPALRWVATAAAVGMAAVLLWPAAPGPDADAPPALVAATSGTPAPDITAAPTTVEATPASAVAALRSAPVVVASRRNLPVPLRVASVPDDTLVARVPPLVRAPQPTPEQLAPLPAVDDVPSRPWPRSAPGQDTYTVEYTAPTAAPPRQ